MDLEGPSQRSLYLICPRKQVGAYEEDGASKAPFGLAVEIACPKEMSVGVIEANIKGREFKDQISSRTSSHNPATPTIGPPVQMRRALLHPRVIPHVDLIHDHCRTAVTNFTNQRREDRQKLKKASGESQCIRDEFTSSGGLLHAG